MKLGTLFPRPLQGLMLNEEKIDVKEKEELMVEKK